MLAARRGEGQMLVNYAKQDIIYEPRIIWHKDITASYKLQDRDADNQRRLFFF